uniref:Uncharacterized protein n=1 Tax=Haptolina ericina TaxID=156174 RepID=A0A7S3BK23_9EUKA
MRYAGGHFWYEIPATRTRFSAVHQQAMIAKWNEIIQDPMTRAFARVALLRATFERNLTIDRNLTKQIVADALPYSQRGNKEAVCPGSRACSSMNTPPRFEGPSCLIVLCGLLRYYREGWRAAQDKVIAANPDVSFAVALLTSAHLTCTDKDRKHGECPCIEKLPGERSMQATIQALVQPLPLVYLQISQHGGNGNQQPHFMYRLAQGWRGLQKHGLAQAFGHVLVLRPDAVLSQPLPLAVTCTDRRVAAFNVISSNFVRPMHFHTRDWDYGYLACDPRSVNLWLWPFFDASPVDALCTKDTLGSTCPALPTVFTGNWTSKDCVDRGNRECAALRLFNAQSEFELSNLDALPVFADLLLNREEKHAWSTPKTNCSMAGTGSMSNRWKGTAAQALGVAADEKRSKIIPHIISGKSVALHAQMFPHSQL